MEIDALPLCPVEFVSLRSMPNRVTLTCEAIFGVLVGSNTTDDAEY